MLAEILKAFRETGGALDLDQLSKNLGAERSAVGPVRILLVRCAPGDRRTEDGNEAGRYAGSP